jgi:hypothetical protein
LTADRTVSLSFPELPCSELAFREADQKEEAMYASVRHYKMGAGSIDSLMHHVDEEFGPALTQEPGFVCYFALDTGDETVETVSIFHDKASADRSNELAAEYVRDNLSEFELTRTGVTAGEVLVSRVAPEALEDAHHPLPSRKAR